MYRRYSFLVERDFLGDDDDIETAIGNQLEAAECTIPPIRNALEYMSLLRIVSESDGTDASDDDTLHSQERLLFEDAEGESADPLF